MGQPKRPTLDTVLRNAQDMDQRRRAQIARQSDSISTFVKFLETYIPDMSQNLPLIDQFTAWAALPGNRVHDAENALDS